MIVGRGRDRVDEDDGEIRAVRWVVAFAWV